MKQFILGALPDSRGMVTLRGEDFHYLARVRRVKPGAIIEALVPESGAPITLTIVSVDKTQLIASCTGKRDPASGVEPPPIYLFQALPRGAKMDLIIRQAAEGGIFEVVPFLSGYSQVKFPDSRNSGAGKLTAPTEKINRWNRIVREARQQSGSTTATAVREPCGLEEALDYWKTLHKERPGGAGIFLHQDPLEPGTFHDYLSSNPPFVVMAVGPEGGFSPEETGQFRAAGLKPVVLGNTVLRTETAALYGAAAIRIILSERASWLLKKNREPADEHESVF